MDSYEIAKLIAERLLEREQVASDMDGVINPPEIWNDEGVHSLAENDLSAVLAISQSSFEDIRTAFDELGADNVMWFYNPLSKYIGTARYEGAQVDNFLCALLSFAYPDESYEQLEARLGDSVSPYRIDLYVIGLCINALEDVIDSGNISNDTIPYTGDNFVLNIALPEMDGGRLSPKETTQVELLFEEVFRRWEQQGQGLSELEYARTAELLAYATRMLKFNAVNQFRIEGDQEQLIDAIGMVSAVIEQYKKWENLPESTDVIRGLSIVKEKMEFYAEEDELFRYPETVARTVYSEISDRKLIMLVNGNVLSRDNYPALD